MSEGRRTGIVTPMATLLWFRRDLRTLDHPALTAATQSETVACFVLDPTRFDQLGPVRSGWLAANLVALNDSLSGRLCLRIGDPAAVIPTLAAEYGATSVHVSAETEPTGAHSDELLRKELRSRGVRWVTSGSPYAVTPGRLLTNRGTGYQVFSGYLRAWLRHGWPEPAPLPALEQVQGTASDDAVWARVRSAIAACPVELPPAGEDAAHHRWQEFLDRLGDYSRDRDRVDWDGTSLMSAHLAIGAIHPRSLLADIADRQDAGADRFRSELAWREFYADVLMRRPDSLTADLNPLPLDYDPPGEQFQAWQQGRTGYPIVDAGQRQLLATGQMPNRVRMINASFLTKDLHLWWRHGAEHFARHLLDADTASNIHNWQWVAGTGTDAAPYFRIFNPTSQGESFDPVGAYVRRWIPELSHLRGAEVHQPWSTATGYSQGYPHRIVDHAVERAESLARYQQAREHQLSAGSTPFQPSDAH